MFDIPVFSELPTVVKVFICVPIGERPFGKIRPSTLPAEGVWKRMNLLYFLHKREVWDEAFY